MQLGAIRVLRGRSIMLTVLCIITVMGMAGRVCAADNNYAWSENAGWLNFSPTHGTVTVVANGPNSYLAGFVWAENVGWIKLGSGTGHYNNSNSSDWGVNMDVSGNLSGFAWSENVGWINFHTTHGQVTIDISTGGFDGFAWGSNIGWIHFKGVAPSYNVRTSAFDSDPSHIQGTVYKIR